MKLPLILLSLLSLVSLRAADPVTFDSGTLPEGWAAAKGEWKVADGSLVGSELAADKHAAVLNIPDAHKNSKITFRYKVDGAKTFALSYNHEKGHLFRIALAGPKLTVSLDKDKKDPASNAEVLGTADLKAKAGEWIDLSCEIEGETVKVSAGDASVSARHPKLAMAKTGYRFVVAGQSVQVDDVAFTSTK